MFTTTNVNPPVVSTNTVACPSFQIMNTTNNHQTLVSLSSSSTNSSWRLTTPSTSVVSVSNENSSTLYIATQPSSITNNIIRQSSQPVCLVSSPFTLINNSNTTLAGKVPIVSSSNHNFQSNVCLGTHNHGRLATSTIQRQQQLPSSSVEEKTSSLVDDEDMPNNQQDSEIELFVNNIVCSFALGCKLNLRKIAMEAANVIYKRGNAMVLMKIRNPYCSANLWSSGKVTVTGTTSEDDAQRAARCVARYLQRLGFKTKFRNYRIVNCLATCSMPWPIDIVKLSRLYPEYVSYEPEIHPGATVRLNNKAVLKVFTTGSVTLTAPSVDRINVAVNDFYPQLFECRKMSCNNEQRQ